MDIASITAAYNGLKTAKDIFTGFSNLKLETKSLEQINEAVKKVGEAQDAIFVLREELFRLQEENNKLRKSLDEKEFWEERIGNYELVTTQGGAVVYKSKGEPNHYICPSCTQSREIHILQDRRVVAGIYECTNCNSTFPVDPVKRTKSIEFTGW